MKKGLLYIHGKGGSSDEAEHYRALFPEHDIEGFDYRAETPWGAIDEFRRFFDAFAAAHGSVILIANSIGAFFSLHSLRDRAIERAYFISPIVDMERLIADMMQWAGVTEQELREKGEIETAFGETLSWEYLSWVREHPIGWHVPTEILYGDCDTLQRLESVNAFAGRIGAGLTVMENGEHWFHTAEQMAFLDRWITEKEAGRH